MELCEIEVFGLPALFLRYRFRFGIPIGALLATLLISLSGLFLWDIDVTGNETVTASEIRALLAGEGFKVGCFLPIFDTDVIENSVMLKNSDIAWMSINVTGTVARVQIREHIEIGEPTSLLPSNVIATKSGVIEEVRVFQGSVTVKAGDNVNEGDLLVSGIIDSERHGMRFTRASGQVFARTVSEFVIEIPYEYEEKVYTGEEFYDKYLNFFDFSINILKNSRNEGVLYDKIDIVENFCFPDGKETPFARRTVKYLAYEKVKMTRDVEAAEALAYFALSEKLASRAEDSILIRKSVTPYVTEDSFMLICSVVMIEDIATGQDFEVELGNG